MSFKIFHAETFDKELQKYPLEFQNWVDKMEAQLVEIPFVGDQIRVPLFREKKKEKFRIYYLIYENLDAVYLVGLSEKKDQQKVINTIFLLLDNFREEIRNLVQ